jgi:hypothetical protein
MPFDTHSFIVRIWQEPADIAGDSVVWRGSIDDVSDGRREYFADTDAIERFIRQRVGLATPEQDRPEREPA